MNREVDSTDEVYMHALSIRQPYAELILRGVKTVEYRSRPTKMVGRRFCIYVPKGTGMKALSREGTEEPLPRGVVVGSAVISHCSPPSGEGEFGDCWQWHLKSVRRYKRPRKLPGGVQPQPVWFKPYRKAA